MKDIALWLDDVRDPSAPHWAPVAAAGAAGGDVVWARTCAAFTAAVDAILATPGLRLVAVMLDWDLSVTDPGGPNGVEAARWLRERLVDAGHGPIALSCHSSSTSGRAEVEAHLALLRAAWAEPRRAAARG